MLWTRIYKDYEFVCKFCTWKKKKKPKKKKKNPLLGTGRPVEAMIASENDRWNKVPQITHWTKINMCISSG